MTRGPHPVGEAIFRYFQPDVAEILPRFWSSCFLVFLDWIELVCVATAAVAQIKPFAKLGESRTRLWKWFPVPPFGYILERFEMKASCPLPWSTEFKDAVTEYDLGVTGLI